MTVSITRVLDARLYGVALVPVTLTYQVADPAAVAIGLSSCRQRHTWHAAREALTTASARAVGMVEHAQEFAAAAVVIATLPAPATDRVLLGLRSTAGRWPVTIAAAHLSEFLGLTYELCSRSREQQLVDHELAAHIELFHTVHGEGNLA